MGRLEELTFSQRRTLHAMGVQLYFKRPSAAALVQVDISDEPVTEALPVATEEVAPVAVTTTEKAIESTAPVDPIRFDWARGRSGAVWLDQIARDQRMFVDDVVRYLDWRHETSSETLTYGTFQWPQLTTSDGTPGRPLTAFLQKQSKPALRWMLVDAYVVEQVLTHLDDLEGAQVIVVDDVAEAMRDADKKRTLWQAIAK